LTFHRNFRLDGKQFPESPKIPPEPMPSEETPPEREALRKSTRLPERKRFHDGDRLIFRTNPGMFLSTWRLSRVV
jgi:hypothetical protein